MPHKNKEELRRYKKEYYLKNLEKIKKRSAEFRRNNSEHVLIQGKEYRNKNRRENLLSWEGFIPKSTNCQMCGRDIFFNMRNPRNSIHFDHRHGGIESIKCPSDFLRNNRRTYENEKLWESCDFGMLCGNCNLDLPTENRKQFQININRYIP